MTSMILNPTLFKACFYAISRTPFNRRSIATHLTIDSTTTLSMYYSFYFLLSFEVDSDCNHTIVTTQQNRLQLCTSQVNIPCESNIQYCKKLDQTQIRSRLQSKFSNDSHDQHSAYTASDHRPHFKCYLYKV